MESKIKTWLTVKRKLILVSETDEMITAVKLLKCAFDEIGLKKHITLVYEFEPSDKYELVFRKIKPKAINQKQM